MISTILAVGGLAFLDSLNPFTIGALALVIAQGNSLSRGLIFIVGTFVAYFFGGVLILNGWIAAIKAVLPFITTLIASALWGIAGLAAIGGAIYLWMKSSGSSANPPTKNTPAALLGIFVFALVSTISDLPTAIPFFGAAPLILGTKPSVIGMIAWISFYCLIYVAPLFLLLWLRLFGGARLEPALAKINKAMDWITRRLTPPLLILLGIWCAINVFSGWPMSTTA
jgi:cytochrome c biogenesis protein CcdA